MVRNPLSPSETLGRFLDALWAKRNTRENKTGCDYLLLTLLVGARKNECAKLQWAEMLTPEERLKNSWVSLKESKIFFYKTKNGQDHQLPLAPCAKELLTRRQQEAATNYGRVPEKQRFFVFPARSKFAKDGHYNDAKDLLDRIKEIAQIPVLTPHDLRRSFGTVQVNLDVPEKISKMFMNHDQAETHSRYTDAEFEDRMRWMIKVEEGILNRSPNIWNALKPADKSPLLAGPLPEIPKDKPRSGRPAKRQNEVGDNAQTDADSTVAV